MADNETINKMTKEWIYAALVRLMDKVAYEKITITKIVTEAGVSRMGYYRNFASKDRILLDRLQANLGQLRQIVETDTNISEDKFWRKFVAATLNNQLLKLIVQAGLTDQLLKIHQQFTQEMFTEVFHWNMCDPQVQYLVNYQMGGQIGLFVYFIQQHDTISGVDEERLTQFIIDSNHALLQLTDQPLKGDRQ